MWESFSKSLTVGACFTKIACKHSLITWICPSLSRTAHSKGTLRFQKIIKPGDLYEGPHWTKLKKCYLPEELKLSRKVFENCCQKNNNCEMKTVKWKTNAQKGNSQKANSRKPKAKNKTSKFSEPIRPLLFLPRPRLFPALRRCSQRARMLVARWWRFNMGTVFDFVTPATSLPVRPIDVPWRRNQKREFWHDASLFKPMVVDRVLVHHHTTTTTANFPPASLLFSPTLSVYHFSVQLATPFCLTPWHHLFPLFSEQFAQQSTGPYLDSSVYHYSPAHCFPIDSLPPSILFFNTDT